MISYIILIFSFIMDGVLSNYLPYLSTNLSLFTPLLTIVSIIVVYPLFEKKDEKKYFIIIFILGLLYDLFYTNLLFYNGIIFLGLGFVIKFLYKNMGYNYFKVILTIILIISLYESLNVLFILLFNLVPISLYRLFYKISHSLLLNVVYGLFIYFIINVGLKKYKKLRFR